jgi:hypothetical protein
MSPFDEFLNRLPPDVQGSVRTIWESLGPDEQNRFLNLLSAFPSDTT